MTASSVLVAFLAATVAALPSTLLEDTKQAAIQSGPIISKGKEQITYHAASLKFIVFVSSTNQKPAERWLYDAVPTLKLGFTENPDFI